MLIVSGQNLQENKEMYAKLVSSGNSTGTGTVAAINNIRNVVAGTITDANSLDSNGHNPGQSFITGSMPTTGIYSISGTTGTTTSYNGSGNFTITKHHYAKGQSVGYTPSRKIKLLADRDYGWRFTVYDSSSGNGHPHSNDNHFWTDETNASYRRSIIPPYNSQMPNNWDEMHIIMNDTTFAFQLITNGTDTQKDYATFVECDLEYMPSIDNHAYSGNSRYCPSIQFYTIVYDRMHNADGVAAQTGTYGFYYGIHNAQYLSMDGQYRNTEFSTNSNYHYGDQDTQYTNYPTMWPLGRSRMYKHPIDAGQFGYPLVPMQYKGHFDDEDDNGDPRYGRLMNWYRTTDDAGFSGDLLTENSTNYRIFRTHKCGKANRLDAGNDYNACYAFPEDNVSF